jgi:hypothetical protein
MKLSNETLKVLYNFSAINQNILLRKGSTIRTRNGGGSVYAEYICDEEFPSDLGIYNLRQLIDVITLYGDPDITVDEKGTSLNISHNSSNTHIVLSDPESLVVTDKKIGDFDPVLTFTLSGDILKMLMKGSGTLKATHMAFESTPDGNVAVTVYDPKPQNSDSNTMSQVVCENKSGLEFKFVFQLSQLNFIQGDYEVSVSESDVAMFKNTNENLTYWLAQDSTYSFSNPV